MADPAATNAAPSSVDGRPGDGAAAAYVEQLYRAHTRMVTGLCRLLLRDAVEAEDAAQQTFLSVHRAILGGSVPRDGAAWIATIARNECRARIKARMRAPLELSDVADDLPDPLTSAIQAADMQALWSALGELPRRQRRAFLLREVGGLSYSELGVALGVTRPAVESLLFRARHQLRESLAGIALLPAALREQFAQLVQGLAGGGGGAAVAAKLAVVTAGIGLGTAGLVALPHLRHSPRRVAERPVLSLAKPASTPTPVVASAPRRTSSPSTTKATDRLRGRSTPPNARINPSITREATPPVSTDDSPAWANGPASTTTTSTSTSPSSAQTATESSASAPSLEASSSPSADGGDGDSSSASGGESGSSGDGGSGSESGSSGDSSGGSDASSGMDGGGTGSSGG